MWLRLNIDLRSFCVAELRSFDINPPVARSRLLADLGANMLSLSVTVGPDEQGFTVSGLIADVLCDWHLILPRH